MKLAAIMTRKVEVGCWPVWRWFRPKTARSPTGLPLALPVIREPVPLRLEAADCSV
jgi:hypothetical protein